MKRMPVRAVTDVKRRATEIIADLETDRPVLITQRGRSAAVLMDVRSYERMVDRLDVLEGIARGERAILEGRIVGHATAKRRLRRWLARD